MSGSVIFGRSGSGRRRSVQTDAAATGMATTPSEALQGFQYGNAAYRNDFNPVLLLEGLTAIVSSVVYIKRGGIRAIGATFEAFFAELRGATVLLFDVEEVERTGSGAVIAMFNVLGCEVTKKVRSNHLVLKKPRDLTTIHMDFREDHDMCVQWERFLTAASRQNRVALRDFEMLHAIGQGASGKVFLVRHKRTGEKLALKSIDKAAIFRPRNKNRGKDFRHAIDERLMLEWSLGDPFFVQLRYAFQTYRKLYLVTEFCAGGDLFYYLQTHGGVVSEAQARHLSAEAILALEAMHRKHTVYRDLKPENVLLDSQGHLKLADFGLCKRLLNTT